MSDPPCTECPKCRKNSLSKKIAPVGFQLKGSGWYMTDYAKNNTQPAAEGEAKTEETKTANTDTETKSDKKTESKE